MSISDLKALDQDPELQKQLKEIKQKRISSAKELLKIKDSVVLDKTESYYGVLSIDKKNPKDKKYYIVNLNWCDCFDFVVNVEKNSSHMCKHMRALEIAIKTKMKIRKIDLKPLLREESL